MTRSSLEPWDDDALDSQAQVSDTKRPKPAKPLLALLIIIAINALFTPVYGFTMLVAGMSLHPFDPGDPVAYCGDSPCTGPDLSAAFLGICIILACMIFASSVGWHVGHLRDSPQAVRVIAYGNVISIALLVATLLVFLAFISG